MMKTVVRSIAECNAILLARGFRILAQAGCRYDESRKLWSAIGCLLRRMPGDITLANRLIMRWTREQNRSLRSRNYGTGLAAESRPRYDDGSFPTPSLYNAFAAPALAYLFRRFGGDLTRRSRQACLETMRHGLFEFLSRDLPLSGYNQSFAMDAGLIIYGLLLDQPAIFKKGFYRLLHHLQLGAYFAPMHEYNSPTYTATSLEVLSGVLAVTRRHDVCLAARLAMERLLLVSALHYHPPTHELAPPHWRAYHGTLSKYAGGMGTVIFKLAGVQDLVAVPSQGSHDVCDNFALAVNDLRISEPLRKIFLGKKWPCLVREVRAYEFPSIPASVNLWPEVTSFYPDHKSRSARMLAAVPVHFDGAVPTDIATTWMTRTYALGTFSANPLSMPYGYGRWHRRGFQFYYRPRQEPETYPMRYGFLAFPNAGHKDTPDNQVTCTSAAGQHRNIAMALYRMAPKRTNACEVFCTLQVADGRECFYDAVGPLPRGRLAQGPLFVHDGQCYLAFLKSGGQDLMVEDRDPALTCYSFYQTKSVPAVVFSHYRGSCRAFPANKTFEGGLAVVMGDADEYGGFESFRKTWSRARLLRHVPGAWTDLALAGVRPALRLRADAALNHPPEFFVAGELQKPDTLESSCARQSHTGKPVRVGPFRVKSHGKPVTAYAAPDGSGCVVLQTLPAPVDLTVRTAEGGLTVRGMHLGRIALSRTPAKIVIETCAPPAAVAATGRFAKARRILRCG
jgi:hypothetical protein